MSSGVFGGNRKPIMSAVSRTVFSRRWCFSVSSRHARCDRMYCRYESATHRISLGPRQYWAAVTRLARYSARIHWTSGRFSSFASGTKWRSSWVSDRSSSRDGFPNISLQHNKHQFYWLTTISITCQTVTIPIVTRFFFYANPFFSNIRMPLVKTSKVETFLNLSISIFDNGLISTLHRYA